MKACAHEMHGVHKRIYRPNSKGTFDALGDVFKIHRTVPVRSVREQSRTANGHSRNSFASIFCSIRPIIGRDWIFDGSELGTPSQASRHLCLFAKGSRLAPPAGP